MGAVWRCEGYIKGVLVVTSYESSQDWFKSANNECDFFRFARIYSQAAKE